MRTVVIGVAAAALGFVGSANCAEKAPPPQFDAMIAKHAKANGVPERLIRRVIMRESKYNPAARNGTYYGMMQIAPATARSMGFSGAPTALLDADTNLTYAVRYLAGAYKVARGDETRAVGLYAAGYYYHAKRQGMLAQIGLGRDGKFTTPTPTPPAAGDLQLASITPATPVAVKTTVSQQPAVVQTAQVIPLPPRRDPAIVVAAATPKAAPVVVASATPAIPLPPVRDASPAVTGAIAPRVQVASVAAPLPPVRPAVAAVKPASQPAALEIVAAKAAPKPAPAAKPVEVAAKEKPRTISPTVEPTLASAGEIIPVRKVVAPAAPAPAVVTPVAAPAPAPAMALAYAGGQSGPAVSRPRASFGGEAPNAPVANAWAAFDDMSFRR